MIVARFDVAVIGGGPAGLAAALSANEHGAKTLLIEREEFLGGKLKQCIHDGYGLKRFGENLTGPQYVHRFLYRLPYSSVITVTSTFVSKVEKKQNEFKLTLVSRQGITRIWCKSIILANGCRECPSCQTGVFNKTLAGILTAGTVQYYTNILGKIPGRRCIIFGSDDIALIMARRLKLEGAEVLGVYEAKQIASGSARNVCHCLIDYDIPLYHGRTITRVLGDERVNAVEISLVDKNMIPVPGTENIVECDALILSADLVPENELAESLGIPLDARTNEFLTDQNYMTMVDGVFCCGNALHIGDIVDYVSESGEIAGRAAAKYADTDNLRAFAEITADDSFLYIAPGKLNIMALNEPVVISFRPKKEMNMTRLSVILDKKEKYRKIYSQLRPTQMERLELDFNKMNIGSGSIIRFSLTEVV